MGLRGLKRLVVHNVLQAPVGPGMSDSKVATLHFERLPRLEELCVGFKFQDGASIFTPVRGIDSGGEVVLKDVKLVDTYRIKGYKLPPKGKGPLRSVWTNETIKHLPSLTPHVDDFVGIETIRYCQMTWYTNTTTFWDVEWYVMEFVFPASSILS